MPIIESPFRPPLLWRNKHLQTMWPALTRKQAMPSRTETIIELSDGDELLLEVTEPVEAGSDRQDVFILFHGLGGSTDSQYIIGMQNLFARHGYTSIAVNSRGAKKPNRTEKCYHGGSSNDIRDCINAVSNIYADRPVRAMGFSIGANALIKYLSENEDNPLASALAISVPMQLEIVVDQLDRGFSKVYRKNLLDSLREYQVRKHAHLAKHHPAAAKVLESVPYGDEFTSFWDYDNEIVAPLSGFDSAADLYSKVSSRQFLHNIKTPTRILQAMDDPFMTKEVIPGEKEISSNVTLEVSRFGGHVGFYLGGNNYYTEQLVESEINRA